MRYLHTLLVFGLVTAPTSFAGGCRDALGYGRDTHRDRVERRDATDRRTFYVRASGADANGGESPSDAWRSLERVNQQDLEPGDSVLFEAGARFSGTLALDADDAGSESAPVYIGSFGAGLATIDAAAASGITIVDAGGFVIENLRLIGGWDAQKQSGNDGEGVRATGTQSGRRWHYLRLRGLEVSGFKLAGIALHATPSDDHKHSGFEDVEISACSVHDNGDCGVLSDGPFTYDSGYSHADVRILEVYAYGNRGLMHKGAHTGSGIVLSDVEQALVEGSIAHDNGEYNDHPQGGGFGIWAWDSKAVTLQFNESFRNRTQSVDGGGFDLDGGVTDSVMQYNYSHDNAGAGYGVFQFSSARPFSNNIAQYNISQNDGFGVLIWDGNGDLGALTVAQNVSFGDKPSLTTYSAVRDGVLLNNIFYGTGAVLLDVSDGEGLTLQGNDYWTGDTPFQIHWNNDTTPATYDSFAAYRAATSAERFDGNDTGMNVDPQLVAAGTAGTLGDARLLATLSMYRLQAGSALIDHGVDPEAYGVTLAGRDFFGASVPRGTGRDVGVYEAR